MFAFYATESVRVGYFLNNYLLGVIAYMIFIIPFFPTMLMSEIICPPYGDVLGCDVGKTAVLYAIVSYIYGCFAYAVYKSARSGVKVSQEIKKEEKEIRVEEKKVKPTSKDYLNMAKIPFSILLLLNLLIFAFSYIRIPELLSLYVVIGYLFYLGPLLIMCYIGWSTVKNGWSESDAAFVAFIVSIVIDIISNLLNLIPQIESYISSPQITGEHVFVMSTEQKIIFLVGMYISGLFSGIFGVLINTLLATFAAYVTKNIKKIERRELIEDAVFIMLLILIAATWVYFIYLPWTKRPYSGITQCSFSPGFTCITWKLYTNGSIYLNVGQGTGKTINITGVVCTLNEKFIEQGGKVIYPSGTSFLLPSASRTAIANPANATLNVICRDEAGKTLTGEPGDSYLGKIYINYTETDSGVQRIVVGSIIAKYEK